LVAPSLIAVNNLNPIMHRKTNQAMTKMNSKCLQSIWQTHKLTFIQVWCSCHHKQLPYLQKWMIL